MNKEREIIASPIIKECARKFLEKNETMTVSELKTFVKTETGHDFTVGQYAGALKTLVDEPGYEVVSRGVYKYNFSNKSDTNGTLQEKVNLILSQTISKLTDLGKVNLLEEQPDANEINRLKDSIEKIKLLIK